MYKKWFKVLVIALGLAIFATASQATLTAVDPGPYTAATGFFPLWYTDSSNTTLDLCFSKAASANGPMCVLLPNPGVFDDTQPTVFPYNFPDESFYFTGDASIVASGVDLTYISALEAAFGGPDGLPAPGDQIVFARIRIRVDVPVAGLYTITHPYGVETFNVTTPGKKAINMTRDIGIGATGVFTGALTGNIGPFLRSVNGPYTATNPDTGALETFVGDPNLFEHVTGSPFSTNFVRIQGPGINLVTFDFAVSGRIWNGVLPTALTVDRSTYTRTGAGTEIDVFATASPTATVTFRESLGLGIELPTTGDTFGKFFGMDAAPATLPPFLVVTATDLVTTPTPLASPLVDVVKISRAFYMKSTQTLTIEAGSSDQVAVPTLSALGFGDLTPGQLPLQELSISPVLEPPATVTVKSSAGGSDTEPVVVTASTPPVVTPPAPISVAAPACATSVPATDPAIVTFLTGATANDTEDGVIPPVNITNNAPVDFPVGVTTVTFFVLDSNGVPGSATSTVTVTGGNTAPVVTAPAPITITVPAGTTTVPATNPAIAAFLAAATATDTQDGARPVTNNAPVNFPAGATTVTFSATDSCTLPATATSTVTITVLPNVAPLVIPPANIILTVPLCATGLPAADAAIAAFLAGATATDPETGSVLGVAHTAPDPFPLGVTTVTFFAVDILGLPGSATATVTVNAAPNTAPVVTAPAPLAIIVPAGTTSVAIDDPQIVAFLAGHSATDAQDGPLAVAIGAPASFPLGVTTVTFTATDSCGLVGTATSTVTVTDNNQLPVANPDTGTTLVNTAVAINVLGNDTDPDGHLPLSVFSVGAVVPATAGTVANNGTSVTFTAGATAGTATFTYVARDSLGALSAPATVTVTITPPVNFAPVAGNDADTTDQQVPVTINVLGNDSDPNGNPIVINRIVARPANGGARIAGNQITYTPNRGFSGFDTFTYQIRDSLGALSNIATVRVTVRGVVVSANAVATLNAAGNRASWVVTGTTTAPAGSNINVRVTTTGGLRNLGSVPITAAGNFRLAVNNTRAIPRRINPQATELSVATGVSVSVPVTVR